MINPFVSNQVYISSDQVMKQFQSEFPNSDYILEERYGVKYNNPIKTLYFKSDRLDYRYKIMQFFNDNGWMIHELKSGFIHTKVDCNYYFLIQSSIEAYLVPSYNYSPHLNWNNGNIAWMIKGKLNIKNQYTEVIPITLVNIPVLTLTKYHNRLILSNTNYKLIEYDGNKYNCITRISEGDCIKKDCYGFNLNNVGELDKYLKYRRELDNKLFML